MERRCGRHIIEVEEERHEERVLPQRGDGRKRHVFRERFFDDSDGASGEALGHGVDDLPAIRGVCGRSERCRGWFVLGLLNWFVVFRWIGSCVVIRGIHCNVIIGLIHNSIVVRLIHGTRIT